MAMTPDKWADIFEDPKQVEALSVLCRADFRSYIQVMFYCVNRKYYQFKEFHTLIIEKLQAIAEMRNEKRNLMLNLPVGSGKSLIVEFFISWCFARSPAAKFVYVSHSQELIEKLSGETKEMINSPEWQKMFGFKLRKDEHSKTAYSFEGAGNRTGMSAASMGSAITGIDAGNPNVDEGEFGGALIIDDPMDVDKSASKVEKEKTIRTYTDKLSTRLRTPKTPIIGIMQRIDVDDLAAYIKEKEAENWDFVTVPALDENDESFYPERFPRKMLLELRETNPVLFFAQYQQNPIVPGGNLFKDYMIQQGDIPEGIEQVFITSDTAYKEKQENDYTVICVWGIKQRQLYLLELVREKLQAAETESVLLPIINHHNRFGYMGAYIEPKGHGIYLNQRLRILGYPMPPQEEIDEFFKDRNQDKAQRANKAIPFLVGKSIVVSSAIPKQIYLACKAELMNFPKGEHDDFVDAVVDGVKYAYNKPLSILDVL